MSCLTWKKSALISAVVLSVFVMAFTFLFIDIAKEPEPTPTTPPANYSVIPVPFPYIFSGNFTVAGDPGPQGIPMFARLGGERGAFNNTVRLGEYTNVSISAKSGADAGKEITFHLGHPDGPTVQAKEIFVISVLPEPRFEKFDLSFPRLP